MQTSATMESEGTFMQLLGPGEDSPALLRRAMDALRREWILEPGLEQPLGAYLKGEELEFHDPSNTFDDSRIHSDSDGGSDDPSGTDSAWSDYMSSDTEATSYDSDGLINKEASDSFDVSSYEGGPPIAAYNGTMTQAAMIKELFNIARAGYPKEFYALQMAVTQHKSTFVNGVDDTVFHLELDTGSNTTWLRGEDVAEIVAPVYPSDRPGHGEPTGYKITKIDYQRLLNKPRVFDHGIPIPRIPDGQGTTISQWQGCIRYGSSDHRRVLLVGRPENFNPNTISLPGTWNWGEEGRWRQPLPVKFVPAIAIAGSPRLVVDAPFDGILGLGTSSYQTAFKNYIHTRRREKIPSFAEALENQLLHHQKDFAVVFYFMLRPPPANEDESPVPSYIAFQRWPCPERQPRWSSKINVDSRTGKWAVTLARLKIWSDVDAVSANPATLARRSPICDVATDKIPGAHKFIMDTGATSTYVHKEILTAIRKAKFLSMNQTNSSSQYPGAPYYVSRDFLQRHDVTVELTFKNTNNSLVSVYVPALGFLYNSLGEGLIWEAPANSGGQASDWSGLLGLNFFQVVYAAFHRPTYHSGIAPYIHLAPQTRADTKAGLYDVPPEKEGH